MPLRTIALMPASFSRAGDPAIPSEVITYRFSAGVDVAGPMPQT